MDDLARATATVGSRTPRRGCRLIPLRQQDQSAVRESVEDTGAADGAADRRPRSAHGWGLSLNGSLRAKLLPLHQAGRPAPRIARAWVDFHVGYSQITPSLTKRTVQRGPGGL